MALSGEFPATAEGYAALAEAIGDPAGCAAVGVEGTCSYGAGLADELSRRGFRVLEVLNKRKERGRRRGEGKDDSIDAERAARDVLAADGTSVPKARGGWVDDLRSLLVARERCVRSKVEAHAAALSLARCAPEAERRRWEGLSQTAMMASMAGIGEEGATPLGRSMLALARAWKACSDEAEALEAEVRRVLEESCPSLLAIYCCGPVSAAQLAVAAGENPSRLRSEASFAMLCGAAPIPASSGKTSGRVRLNRGGDRRANSALHTIAVRRMRYDPKTREYVSRRCGGERPLSKREARGASSVTSPGRSTMRSCTPWTSGRGSTARRSRGPECRRGTRRLRPPGRWAWHRPASAGSSPAGTSAGGLPRDTPSGCSTGCPSTPKTLKLPLDNL